LNAQDGAATVSWTMPAPPLDSRLFTHLRYFSRDAARNQDDFAMSRTAAGADPHGHRGMAVDGWTGGFAANDLTATAGWNDHSTAGQLSRAVIDEQAGIEIPSRRFLACALGLYLACLIPVNFCVFRGLDRLEWAWLAAPLISVLGAFFVVRSAQLDIGFVRSCTEMGILELQPAYPRGHLTRFIALYSSLTTRYRILSDRHTLLLPFSPTVRPQNAPERHLEYHYDQDIQLSGFTVLSNSTGMLHTEQMLDLSGDLRLVRESDGSWRVQNGTPCSVRDAVIIWRTERLAATHVPGLAARSGSAIVRPTKFADAMRIAERAIPSQNLLALFHLATDPDRIPQGGSLLVGWSEDPLPGLQIEPSASQNVRTTLVVANLQTADLPAPDHDQNSPLDLTDAVEFIR
jgi:hypothetical protein